MGNFGPGFDVLSLALEREGDTIELTPAPRDEIVVTGAGAERIPLEWSRNTACAAIDRLRETTGNTGTMRVAIHKGMPPGSGLGSSASSSAGAVRAFVQAHDITIDAETALDAAGAGEAAATGIAHFDDAAAALYGGLTIVGGARPDSVIRLRPPPLHLVVARQDVELSTREMRGLIPAALPRMDVIRNLGNVARIVHACHAQDAAMLCRALDDRISRPYRAPRVPRYDEMRDASMRAGANAFLLSGSGPAVIAACVSAHDAKRVEAALRGLVDKGEVFTTRPCPEVNSPGIRLH